MAALYRGRFSFCSRLLMPHRPDSIYISILIIARAQAWQIPWGALIWHCPGPVMSRVYFIEHNMVNIYFQIIALAVAGRFYFIIIPLMTLAALLACRQRYIWSWAHGQANSQPRIIIELEWEYSGQSVITALAAADLYHASGLIATFRRWNSFVYIKRAPPEIMVGLSEAPPLGAHTHAWGLHRELREILPCNALTRIGVSMVFHGNCIITARIRHRPHLFPFYQSANYIRAGRILSFRQPSTIAAFYSLKGFKILRAYSHAYLLCKFPLTFMQAQFMRWYRRPISIIQYENTYPRDFRLHWRYW